MSDADHVFAEARRQLTICNACRYCEGYCAVWPALERRRELTSGDVIHLANLCHDCRDCLYACMYSAPHPFELDPPSVFAQVRDREYSRQSGPSRGRWGRLLASALTIAVAVTVVVVVVASTRGFGAVYRPHSAAASPYSVVPYPILLVVMGAPFAWGVAVAGVLLVRYWRTTRGELVNQNLRRVGWAAARALGDAATLRNLRGGGDGCRYPTEKVSGARRYWHHLVSYGFTACVGSTVSAGVLQDLVGRMPPYPLVSVPVLLGTLGGVGLVVGCAGLVGLRLIEARSAAPSSSSISGLLFVLALGGIGTTGLLCEALRTNATYGVALTLHLAVVGVCFALVPYTKFMHVLYRYIALVHDELEKAAEIVDSGGSS